MGYSGLCHGRALIAYRLESRPATDEQAIVASEDDRYVGELCWYIPGIYDDDVAMQPYEITYVFVYSSHRRQGIATEMLRQARLIEPRIVHSPVRSWSGNEWAKSTGDPLPKSFLDPLMLPRR